MVEPLALEPEVYLAMTTSLRDAVDKYKDKKRAKQNKRLAIVSAADSRPSLILPADQLLMCSGLKVGNDGYLQWDLGSPAHPANWSRRRKAYDLGLILFLEFFMTTISAGGTPASFYGSGALGQKSEVGLVGFTTTYLLGQALGILLFTPYSDELERRTLYIASAFLYSVFCLPVAATSSLAGVSVGRLVTGAISAIPAVTTRQSIEDLFRAEGRMWSFFFWALVTNLGLVLGPIYASYVAVSLNWRWTFYLATIIVAVTGMLMYFMRESHTSWLLERKVAVIQSNRADLNLRTAPTAPRPSILQPVVSILTNPTIFLSSIVNAFSTALLYVFAVAFPLIYAQYSWSRQKTTLIFLFIALGLLVSTLTRFHDRYVTRKHHLANRSLAPENGLSGLVIGAPALAAGLWWFAWTIPSAHVKAVAWPASAVSLILLGYGINEYSVVLPRYVVESQKSPTDAASAFAATLMVRALLSAVFPLFTRQLFEKLGNNAAGSVLAAIATASCILPFILIKFGTTLRRRRSPSGCTSDDDSNDIHESGQKRPVEKAPKPKKTVRWDDETPVSNNNNNDDGDDGSERTKSETPMVTIADTLSIADSNLSSTDTIVPEPDTESTTMEPTEMASRFDEQGTEGDAGAHAAVTGAGAARPAGNKQAEAEAAKRKKQDQDQDHQRGERSEMQEKKKHETGKDADADADADDRDDDTLAGFLGVDFERVVAFPLFF